MKRKCCGMLNKKKGIILERKKNSVLFVLQIQILDFQAIVGNMELHRHDGGKGNKKSRPLKQDIVVCHIHLLKSRFSIAMDVPAPWSECVYTRKWAYDIPCRYHRCSRKTIPSSIPGSVSTYHPLPSLSAQIEWHN